MNISYPDKNSAIYDQFLKDINQKVKTAIDWLAEHHIEYVWNNWVDNHLYRLYIPSKDLLLDFEPYPVNNINYNYIRISYDTDIIQLLEKLFPETILDTKELVVQKLNQKVSNKFLRENQESPIYDKSALRLSLVKDSIIYQCVIIKDNKIISNVSKRGCSVPYGTYILLRYLNEMFGYQEILLKEDTSNSYVNTLYQLLGLPILFKSSKRKIWWGRHGCKWRIKKELTSQFVPFYLNEIIIYRYPTS